MVASREDLQAALGRVIDPELRRPVTELDMVRSVDVVDGHASVRIALTVAGCPLRSSFQEQVARELGALDGVDSVSLEFDVMSPEERKALTTKLRGGVTGRSKGISVDAATRVLAVVSGKGGVGKSSVTVNLAAALSAMGQRVGVLDADVYGHSIPHMLGIHQKPVVVTTPQPLAQEVASRAAAMARTTSMRLVGVVENMAGDVFGTGGGEELAAALETPFLGRILLDSLVRECGDAGEPLVWAEPDSAPARELAAIAEAVARAQAGTIVKPLTVLA